jgi:hypothetical protein
MAGSSLAMTNDKNGIALRAIARSALPAAIFSPLPASDMPKAILVAQG